MSEVGNQEETSTRQELIRKWEAERGTKLVSYFLLTDRPNLGLALQINDDAMRPLSQILKTTDDAEQLDLFLYTRGGSMNAAHNIVKTIRQKSKRFNVIVPFRAHSAGTQIALGADKIVMGSFAQLSPIDPSTTSLFNPILNPQLNPGDLNNRKPISVEDVQSYLNLAKERTGLVSESDRLEAFRELTRNVEPLALGNVNRVYEEAQIIARDLLSMHMSKKEDGEKIEAIVKKLTQTYTHFFLVTRDDAERIGLKVEKPTPTQETMIMDLYGAYESYLMMNQPYDPDSILTNAPLTPLGQREGVPTNQPQQIRLKMGVIEDRTTSFTFVYDGTVYPPISQYVPGLVGQAPYPPQPAVRIKMGTWRSSTGLGGGFA